MSVAAQLSNFQFQAKLWAKWRWDRLWLPLTLEHQPLYDRIHRTYYERLGRFPELVRCAEYNERIQWLKLFDQHPSIPKCCDKLGVRDHVRSRLGDRYLLNVFQSAKTFDEIDFGALPASFVLKTNHDAGGVVLVRDKATFDRAAVKKKIEDHLSGNIRGYGWEGGEWGYGLIDRRVFAEEMLPIVGSEYPVDYKFHCVDGRVKFLHFISDRGAGHSGLKEQIASRDGIPDQRQLGHFTKGDEFAKPHNWDEMVFVAERLSQGFKYVRVDLFNVGGAIYAGEMTFWPWQGMYEGDGQKEFGPILDFDRTTVRPLVRSD